MMNSNFDNASRPGGPESIAPHSGKNYLNVLRDVHAWLKPRNYLEIGVNRGKALLLAECASIAIDPKFLINEDVIKNKPQCHFFQKTSDDFFSDNNPYSLFGTDIHIAFLDGLHEYECLLRDFMNVEKFSGPDSIIIMHDCVPTDIFMARRHQHDQEIRKLTPTPASWTGDVWKTIVALRKFRPDLKITSFDAAPTGLVFIQNLDSNSTVLAENYNSIIQELSTIELIDYGLDRYHAELDVQQTSLLGTQESMIDWLS